MNCLECNEETNNPKFCSKKCLHRFADRKYRNQKTDGNCNKCGVIIAKKNSKKPKYCQNCWQIVKRQSRPNKEIKPTVIPKCKVCDIIKTDQNSCKTKSGTFNTYCKKCSAELILIRTRRLKEKCVNYKGGKCEKCGYNQCLAALQFHHKDPNQKDFGIAGKTTFNDTMIRELEKCSLLCSNCHFELHSKESSEISELSILYLNSIKSK